MRHGEQDSSRKRPNLACKNRISISLGIEARFWRSHAQLLARIIHIFEDNKSLLCYKHVD